MSYCRNCGLQLDEGQNFCPGCGTAVRGGTTTAAETGPEPVRPPVLAPVADSPATTTQASISTDPPADRQDALQKLGELRTQSPPPASNSGKKILIAILAIFFLGGIAAVGGIVYLGYRVKQRSGAALNKLEGDKDGSSSGNSRRVTSDDAARELAGHKDDGASGGRDDSKDNPLSSLLSKLQGGDSSTPMGNMAKGILEDAGVKNPDMPADLVRNIPYSALATPLPCPTGGEIDLAKLASGKIQIKPGTILTTSWSLPLADAESDHIIESVSPAALVFEFSGIAALGLDMSLKSHPVFRNTVCGKDVIEGRAFATGWVVKSMKEPIAPGLYPGLSRILLPATKFRDLKSPGSMELVFAYYDYMDALTEWELLAWKGTLARVEPDDVPFPLIINDERVNVPSIHVRGNMKVIESAGRFGTRDQPADAYILDDPNTPVVLSWMFGKDLKQDDAFRVQYVRVRYPDKPTIEQQLAKNRRAITWGINFDFNSDVIRPGSESVLKEIANAMADKPDWRLTIAGHTDNIGGHKYNLDLSQRRSAAVKKALVERHHADANRFSTAGYGDSGPIDTNDTLEGRARNRRVELTLD